MHRIIRALHQADPSLRVIDEAELARIQAQGAAAPSSSRPPPPPTQGAVLSTPPAVGAGSGNKLRNQGPQEPAVPVASATVRTPTTAPVVAAKSRMSLFIAGAVAVALVLVLGIGISIGSSSRTIATPTVKPKQSQPATDTAEAGSAVPDDAASPFDGTVCSGMPTSTMLTIDASNNSSAVRAVQAALHALNYSGTSGTILVRVDGDYGSHTEFAVRKFQSHHGLIADGKVGPETWTELGSELKSAGAC